MWGRFYYLVCLLMLLPASYCQAVGSLSAKTSTEKPVIQYISTAKCLKEGDKIQVRGDHFMPAKGRTLIFVTGNGQRVKLDVSSWTEQSINARLPRSPYTQPGTRYPLVIINTKDQRVLSNRDKTILICDQQKPEKQKPEKHRPENQTSKKQTDAVPVKPSSPTGAVPAKPETDSFSGYETTPQNLPPGKEGSLIGSGAPQAVVLSDLKQLPDNRYEAGELVVISKNLEAAKQLAAMVAENGYRVKRRRVLKSLGMVVSVISIPREIKLDDALQQLQQRDKSLLIDANHRYQYASSSNDKQNNNNAHDQIHESIGWGKVNKDCGRGVKIGVIDSLVDTTHPSFRDIQIVNKSLLPFGVKLSDKQHATAIASILVGQPDSPVTGLLPAAKLYVAGVFRTTSDNRVDTTAELIVNALDYLVGNNVHAINLSLAGPRNRLLDISIQKLLKKNVLIVAAVGNHGLTNVRMYPAAIKGVVSVTAIDTRGRIYKKANQGDFVQIAAPGVDIWAARENGKFSYVSGTSFASPYVTAALAVMKHTTSKKSAGSMINALYQQAQDLGKKGQDPIFGWGHLQFTSCR